MQIGFHIPGVPVAQPRQRHRQIKKGGKSFIQNYTPAKSPVNAFKAVAALSARASHSGAPLDGPLSVWLVFVMPRPASMRWKSKPMPREHHASKPDFDNLAKSLCDALKGIVWRDDSQIAAVEVHKYIAAGDEQPHVEVLIEQLV